MPRQTNFPTIVAAVPDPTRHRVTLTWQDGTHSVHAFGDLLGRGVFAALRDPAFFARVQVGEHGRTLEWPNEIDFCADALWQQRHPSNAPTEVARTEGHPAL